ncbi:hypothetical protein DdX_16185 [Ditylenchus destructor]|uniref:Uncharacterized protein n=1 Tax=Ditylenchus destructor TaxID=166010 RepID=A0AAD4R044_9BILA|nr:hypothetical protein DdX_16185 [Ditylenchus destructor]
MEALRKGELNLPEPQAVPGIGKISYFLLGDEFPFSNSFVKSFGAIRHTLEQRRFNYRHKFLCLLSVHLNMHG